MKPLEMLRTLTAVTAEGLAAEGGDRDGRPATTAFRGSECSHRRLCPFSSPTEHYGCLHCLTFHGAPHESHYMAVLAGRALSCSVLQRLLAAFLTLVFCAKEVYTAYRHHVTPRCPARCNAMPHKPECCRLHSAARPVARNFLHLLEPPISKLTSVW